MWFLFLSQGGGCDYTIGCGMTGIRLKATTEEEARAEAKEKLEYYGFNDDNKRLDLVGSQFQSGSLLMEVSKTVPLDSIMAQLQEEIDEAVRKADIAEKKKQLKRLSQELAALGDNDDEDEG
jgi:uncharacterized protein YlaN (UPF0358 family)